MKTGLSYEAYQKGLEEGSLLGLLCENCGTVTIPPKPTCRKCGSARLATFTVEPKGTIRTFTVIRVAPEGMTAPYVVALVETSCGAWVLGSLTGIDSNQAGMDLIGKSVAIGSRVVVADPYTHKNIRSPQFILE
ncbi:MAG: OB-fold domain-containing protein [Pseudomonadota bacterium]